MMMMIPRPTNRTLRAGGANVESVGVVVGYDDGGVDFFEFLEIDQQFPMAFFPVFRMQDTLQSRTLTPDVWINLGRSVPTGIW